MSIAKKGAALVVAIVAALTLTVSAAFADTTTYKITGPSDGHTYKVYQIFTGDLNNSKLSNVKWGANGTGTKGEAVDEATISAIQKLENNTDATGKKIAEYVNFESAAVANLTDSNATAEVPAGYYLIEDEGPAGEGDSYSTYVVSVVKDLKVSTKKAVPTFEKKIKDTNDSVADSTTGWQDSADYDIGDAVPFQLKGTVPSNYASYDTYYYKFTDQMEPSLTFDASSVVVKVGDKVLTKDTDYTVTTGKVSSSDTYNGGDTFTVEFKDLKKVSAVTAGSTITVEYNATLNDNAVLGSQGNVNEAKLTYSNKPNHSGEGDTDNTGETPWDNVIVFTYQTVVNKVDSDKKPLAGAEFTLYKKLADGTEKAIQAVTAESGTQFTFKGLDDGNYVLKETKTPEGYNTASDIEFTISADHDIEWATQARTEILNTLSGGNLGDGSVSTGTITTDVVNKAGAELPSTGGMGTTILYVLGGLMVVVAGVLLVTKRRASRNQ